ncbi:hypothetical protein KC730_00010 [Candidatus Kaiserbacteria bacterium]|nr:hypothetical protein [Candidatus Kaiserbacteria bacterium]
MSNNDEKTWVKYPCTIADRPFAENKAEALEAGVSEQRAQGVGVMGLVFSDDFIMSAQRVLFTDNNSIGYRPANVWEKSKFGIHPVCLARKTEVDGVLIYGYRYTEGNLSDQLMVQYCTTPIPGKQEDINQAWCVYTSGNNCQTQKIIGESPNQKAEAFEACQEEKKSRIQACEKKKKDKKKEACIKKAQAVSCANL